MKSWKGLRLALPLTLAIFAGSAQAQAITCTVTPAYSIVTEGQTIELQAQCDKSLASANWAMDGVSVTGDVALGQGDGTWTNCSTTAPTVADCPPPVRFTTPVAAGAAASHLFTITGTGLGEVPETASGNDAMVVVKPANVLAAAEGEQNPTAPVNGACGSANGSAVTSMPTGTAQCATGTVALAITSPASFSWSCLSPNSGSDASCYALRGYTVAAQVSGANGTVSPASQGVAAGGTATVTATPTTGYSALFTSSCGGSASNNSFTTGAVNANCTVTASFNNNVSGVCGSQSGQVSTAVLTSGSANLCTTGGVVNFATTTSGYTWGCQGTGTGATPSCSATKGYTVTASAGANGTITPSSRTVGHGSTTTFTVTPSATYEATMGGTCPAGSLVGTTYTTGAITAGCTVTATFAVPATGISCDGVSMPGTIKEVATSLPTASFARVTVSPQPTEVYAYKMVVPAGTTPDYGAVTVTETALGLNAKHVVISACKGDYNQTGKDAGCVYNGQEVSKITYMINRSTTSYPRYMYCHLTPGQTYWVNVSSRKTPTSTPDCTTPTNCGFFFEAY